MRAKSYIYLASPYSDPDPGVRHIRELQINEIAGKLFQKHKKLALFAPISQSANIVRACPELSGTWETWAHNDLVFVHHCDAVWVVTMRGWEKSKGVTAEVKYAKHLGKPVYYVHPETLEISEEPVDA